MVFYQGEDRFFFLRRAHFFVSRRRMFFTKEKSFSFCSEGLGTLFLLITGEGFRFTKEVRRFFF